MHHAEAVGRFICTGKTDDGGYELRLVALNSMTADTGSEAFGMYFDPTDGQKYEVVINERAFNPNHGFKNAGTFILGDGQLTNEGGGQVFTSSWNHSVGE